MTRRTVVFLIVVSVIPVLSGCREIPTSATVKNGPLFLLHGSGRLASFRIYGPKPGRKIAVPFDAKSLVWRVQPAEGYFKGSPVEGLQIEYGIAPNEYTQTIPDNGTAPTLPDRQVYYFFAETTNAPPAEGFFYLDGTAPVQIHVPGLCQSGFVGEVTALKCGTKEPYIEPSNLEQFVRENRIDK